MGGSWVSRSTAANLSGRDPDTFELITSDLRYPLCVRCRETVPCHLNHVAPQVLFADADHWPIIPLCPSCHTRWHSIMTPGLCTPYVPADHVALLAGYLKPQHLDALRQALTDHLATEAMRP